jgi:3-isopropylmalate dehydratase small subunit
VKCVIVESFAFSSSRNSHLLSLVTIIITDPAFYKLTADGAERFVDLDTSKLGVGGKTFELEFSSVERQLMELGSITRTCHKHGETMFQNIVKPADTEVFRKPKEKNLVLSDGRQQQLAW